MALPLDVQHALQRMRINAAVDELRLMAEQLAQLGKHEAASFVNERATLLLARQVQVSSHQAEAGHG